VLYKTYLMLFDSRKIGLSLGHVDTLQGDSYITCSQCFITVVQLSVKAICKANLSPTDESFGSVPGFPTATSNMALTHRAKF
jgi:hypothetical protein